MKDQIEELLTEIYEKQVSVVDFIQKGGGCINETQILCLSIGKRVFLKHHSSPPEGFFSKEARGLKMLGVVNGGPRVPKVLSARHESFLLLEYIPQEPPREGFYESFARDLVALHRTSDRHYGLDHDNFIGKTKQKNTKEENPIVFFSEHRIRFQQTLARQQGLLPIEIDRNLDIVCDRLGDLLDVTGEKPALCHGDLWSGNYLCGQGQMACIFDPAVHFSLRETDLAMTELFGRMPQRFYDAYNEVFPINPGYEQRRDIYNLYHLLNHVNLFGASYLDSVQSILKNFIK